MAAVDETLAAPQLERVQAMAETMVGAASQTIRPGAQARGTTTLNRAGEALDALRKLGPGQAQVELGETLGRGGMGHVRLGRQLSMGREVAVKTTREDRRSERATLELLREAWVTGALEHPNILPIYEVGLDEAGAPVIVMRRVDGEDWSALMHEGASVAERFGEEDLLEWNLRVLMQVCRALSRAHELDIVHRDVKPANVMLGAFGEVYLVDWGIAVSVGDDGEGRFPRPEAEGEVVGTPAYMAPEMLAGRSADIGPRTDVYLLGAVLYELLSGEAPHRREVLAEFVDSVMRSQVRPPSSAPPELAEICIKAMAVDPDQRHASVEQLRLAIAAFLRHRSSTRLAARGQDLLGQLRALLGEPPELPEASTDERERGESAAVQRLFSEARFTFETSLREWEHNEQARDGLRELLIAMSREHLRRAEHGAAAQLMSELDPVPPQLREGLERLRAQLEARAQERERLEQLSRDNDARFGQRTRWFGIMMLGGTWSLSPLAAARWMPVPGSVAELAGLPFALALLAAGFGYWARESLLSTSYNRKFIACVGMSFVFQLIIYLGGLLSGATVAQMLVPPFFLWFVMLSLISIALESRLWPAALGYLAAFLYLSAAEARIEQVEELARCMLRTMSLAHAGLTLTILVIWWPRSVWGRLPDEAERGSG